MAYLARECLQAAAGVNGLIELQQIHGKIQRAEEREYED